MKRVIMLNPFDATYLYLHPLKTSGFLMFSGGVERDQWRTIGLLKL